MPARSRLAGYSPSSSSSAPPSASSCDPSLASDVLSCHRTPLPRLRRDWAHPCHICAQCAPQPWAERAHARRGLPHGLVRASVMRARASLTPGLRSRKASGAVCAHVRQSVACHSPVAQSFPGGPCTPRGMLRGVRDEPFIGTRQAANAQLASHTRQMRGRARLLGRVGTAGAAGAHPILHLVPPTDALEEVVALEERGLRLRRSDGAHPALPRARAATCRGGGVGQGRRRSWRRDGGVVRGGAVRGA